MERRLAAILAADMVCNSRLIRADEEGALAAIKLQSELIYPKVSEHHGCRVKLMGEAPCVRQALNLTNRHREPPA